MAAAWDTPFIFPCRNGSIQLSAAISADIAAIKTTMESMEAFAVMQSIMSLGIRAVNMGISTRAGTRSMQNQMLFLSHSHQLCNIYRTFSREECNFFST